MSKKTIAERVNDCEANLVSSWKSENLHGNSLSKYIDNKLLEFAKKLQCDYVQHLNGVIRNLKNTNAETLFEDKKLFRYLRDELNIIKAKVLFDSPNETINKIVIKAWKEAERTLNIIKIDKYNKFVNKRIIPLIKSIKNLRDSLDEDNKFNRSLYFIALFEKQKIMNEVRR